jgi:hypothetical protein
MLSPSKCYPKSGWVAAGNTIARPTDETIEALKPRTARYEVWDEARKGFGVRVSPRGIMSFVWVYHFAGKPRRLTFGTYPRLSLADAGLKLAKAKNLLDKGLIQVRDSWLSAKLNGTPRRWTNWSRLADSTGCTGARTKGH